MAGLRLVLPLDLLLEFDSLHRSLVFAELLSQSQLYRVRLRGERLLLLGVGGVLLWDLQRVAEFILVRRLYHLCVRLIVRF